MPPRRGRHTIRHARRVPVSGSGSARADLIPAGPTAADPTFVDPTSAAPAAGRRPESLLGQIEHLLLIDLADGRGTPRDYAAIAGQLRWLLGRAGLPRPTRRQAAALLRLTEAVHAAVTPSLIPPAPPAEPDETLPVVLRVGLARFIAAHEPLPPNWAFSWHAHLADRHWLAPATDHPDEFRRRFAARYRRRYPEGMLIPHWSRPLEISYATCHPRFERRVVHLRLGLPDVDALDDETLELNTLGVQVQRELTPNLDALLAPARAAL